MKIRTVPRIVAIGDSLIYGRHDAQGSGWIGRLRKSLETNEPASAVFNLGIGGNNSSDVLERFDQEVVAREPNCIIIGVGTNDARRSDGPEGGLEIPLDEYSNNIRLLLRKAANTAKHCVIASVLPVDERKTCPLAGLYYKNEELHGYWAAQKRLCAEAGATFLDFWSTVMKGRGPRRRLFSDGLHLTARGHAVLFEAAEKRIGKLFS